MRKAVYSGGSFLNAFIYPLFQAFYALRFMNASERNNLTSD